MHRQLISDTEEMAGKELLFGYKVSKMRRTGREILFGEEREFSEFFWLAEESCIPLRHEDDMIRTEMTNIQQHAVADALFMLPADYRKVSSLAALLQ